MVNIAIVGLQWGDEGKAKILDEMVDEAKQDNDKKIWVVRAQGGPNAGHTMYVRVKGKDKPVKFVTHAAPSGLTSNSEIAIGPHTAFDPEKFMMELNAARELFGYDAGIHISERVGILIHYHRLIDGIQEDRRTNKIGTTGSGIGPFYMDNADRSPRITFAAYVGDGFHDKLRQVLEEKRKILESKSISIDDYMQELIALHDPIRKELKDYSCRLEYRLNEALRNGENIIVEGAQGTGLDVDYGTIPDQTASHLLGPQLLASLALPRSEFKIYGIEKLYPTRVGGGVMPTLAEDDFAEIGELSGEVGATTGRKRRIGYPDWVYIRYAAMINDIDGIFLTRADCVQDRDIKVCTGYLVDGNPTAEVPLDLTGVKPVYESDTYRWRLWQGERDLSNPQEVDERLAAERKKYVEYAGIAGLPSDLNKYARDHARFVKKPIMGISIGPTRGETVTKNVHALTSRGL